MRRCDTASFVFSMALALGACSSGEAGSGGNAGGSTGGDASVGSTGGADGGSTGGADAGSTGGSDGGSSAGSGGSAGSASGGSSGGSAGGSGGSAGGSGGSTGGSGGSTGGGTSGGAAGAAGAGGSEACDLTVLLDDPFSDSDLSSGGNNGGFVLRSNGLLGTGSSVSEEQGVARIVAGTESGGNPNIGMGSIPSIDATAAASAGLTIRWEMTHADLPVWQGISAFLSREDEFYENNTALGLRVTGAQADDFDPYHVGLLASVHGVGVNTYDQVAYDAASLTDGFVLFLEISETGWAFRVVGLDDGGSTLSASGTWDTDYGYSDLLDSAVYVGAAIQGDNVNPARLDVARLTVFSGICPTGVDPTLP